MISGKGWRGSIFQTRYSPTHEYRENLHFSNIISFLDISSGGFLDGTMSPSSTKMNIANEPTNPEHGQLLQSTETSSSTLSRFGHGTDYHSKSTELKSAHDALWSGHVPQSGRKDHAPTTDSQEHQWDKDSNILTDHVVRQSTSERLGRYHHSESTCQHPAYRTEAQSWPLMKRLFVAGVICLYT